ncbi:hypothetical protein J2N86_08510 [Legionella lytica]|uniref:Uncharacterized protein n=1 Tax=Legionella lytica TaxID=96232 RepID=A0ABY4Y6L6_9GAMM|nr:hypothetical protein [Legionella lytica]USQ12749.1 hypothetical protein J2N86_08510 [Legionella lytica]
MPLKTCSYTISEALTTLKKGVLLFLLLEHLNIDQEEIIGVSGDKHPKVSFNKDGFSKIINTNIDVPFIEKNATTQSIKINDLNKLLQALSSQKIMAKFPYFFSMHQETQYDNVNAVIEDHGQVNRCEKMQRTWQQWGVLALPHLISSHQALQRILAAKMKRPLAHHLDISTLENGLSIEYQCEIYSNHVYGAKLLDIWHDYLMSTYPQSRHPKKFLEWLSKQSPTKLQNYGINHLDALPKVNYLTTPTQRTPWLLHFKPGNIVEGASLPKPTKQEELLEIIYVLGLLENKEVFLGGVKKRGVINHSSFFGGEKTQGAGKIILKSTLDTTNSLSWIFHKMDNNSGHIKPTDQMTIKILEKLMRLGLDLKAIAWNSKWGAAGQYDENALIALKRLKQDFSYVKIFETTHSISSKRLEKIALFAQHGAVKELLCYLTVRSYKISINEVITTSMFIMHTLKNHLLHCEKGTLQQKEKPQTARKLVNQAIELLKNSGIYCPEFEEELEVIILQFKNRPTPQQTIKETQENSLNQKAHSHYNGL